MEQNFSGRKLEICKEILETLSDYIDQELPFGACQEVDDYIGGCEKRRAFVESLRSTVDLCHKFEMDCRPGPMQPEFKKNLLAAYQKAMRNCGHGSQS